MGSEFTFYVYADSAGSDAIREWIKTDPHSPDRVKARLDDKVDHLSATPWAQWVHPLIHKLDGECAGLFELRIKVLKQNYRFLGFRKSGTQVITLVSAFIKTSREVPPSECDDC